MGAAVYGGAGDRASLGRRRERRENVELRTSNFFTSHQPG